MKRKWVSQIHILTWFWDYREYKSNLTVMYVLQNALQDDIELDEWCRGNNCTIQDTHVICPDMETYVLFAARWVS